LDLLSAPRSIDASAVTCDIKISDRVRDELRYTQSARRLSSESCRSLKGDFLTNAIFANDAGNNRES